METSPPNIEASMETSTPIPRTGYQTSLYNSKAFIEASAPHSQAFIQVSPVSRRSGFVEKSAHTSMEPLIMPNTCAFRPPLSHHTSMEDFPCHQGFIQTSSTACAVLDTGDVSANSANPCTINMIIKKEELPACCTTRRIGNSSTSRQVMFCKRRNGLFKKAHELSILCDAEVAALVFSPSGRISEFASSSMNHIIKRYQSFQPQIPSNNVLLQDVERWKHDVILLNSKIKCLEDFQSCVFEKNSTSLSINEVQSVESMLEHALDKIRKRKMELFESETQKIIEKREIICKENNVLKEKIMEIIPTKESVSNASSVRKELYYD